MSQTIQHNRSDRRGSQPGWAGRNTSGRAASLICVLLLSLLAFIQVAHVHPAASDADHCSICVAMQSAAPVAVTAPAIVFTTGIARVPVPVVPTVARRWHYIMFNRPPPDAA